MELRLSNENKLRKCVIMFVVCWVVAGSSGKIFVSSMLEKRNLSSFKTICVIICLDKCHMQPENLISEQCREDCTFGLPTAVADFSMILSNLSSRAAKSFNDLAQSTDHLCFHDKCQNCSERLSSLEILVGKTFLGDPLGTVDFTQSLCYDYLIWSNPQEFATSNRTLNRVFVWEEYVNRTWSFTDSSITELPQLTVSKSNLDRTFRCSVLGSSGPVSVSPNLILKAEQNRSAQLLPVGNLQMKNLSFSGNRVNALLTWELPKGLLAMDVNSYEVHHSTTYCEIGSLPAVTLTPGKALANVSNMRMDCSYQFNVSYETVCDGKSSPALLSMKIDCNIVKGPTCGKGSQDNFAHAKKEPETVVVQNVVVFRNGSADICANISWTPPADLGSSTNLTGYEIWWGPIWHPMESATWFYEFSDNVSKTQSAGEKNTFLLCSLQSKTKYGVKVAALGNVPYNVSNVMQFKFIEPFDTTDLNMETLSDAERNGRRTGTMFLYIAVPIIFTLIFCAFLFGYLRYRKQQTFPHGFEKLPFLPQQPLILRYKISNFQPDTVDKFKQYKGETLGKGAFGEVFKGVIKGTVLITTASGSSSKRNAEKYSDFTVAVKLLAVHNQACQAEKEAFLHEIDMMKEIGYHRNIVSLIGCCLNSESLCLVEEYCALGDLQRYLTSKRMDAVRSVENAEYFLQVNQTEHGQVAVTLGTLLSYARQIAIGMEYLHQKGFVHRDLAARNILLADETFVKIGDFGLSRHINDENMYVMKSPGRLPVKWMAIEAISDLVFTPASDVWSFGIVLFEIITLGGSPYPSISNQDLLPQLKSGYRMECPDSCPDEIYSSMLHCWSADTTQRPSFNTLVAEMERLIEKLAVNEAYLRLDFSKDYYTVVDEEHASSLQI